MVECLPQDCMLVTNLRCAVMILSLTVLPSFTAAFAISSHEIEQLIKSEKLFEASTKIVSAVSNDQVTVQLHLSYSARVDEDLYKIDAALIAKDVFNADRNVKKVCLRFYNGEATSFKQVLVRSIDVKAFGSGAITKEDLLSTLEITNGHDATISDTENGVHARLSGSEPDTVANGPLAVERRKLLGRIKELKLRGVGVKPFLDRFATLESKARENDTSKLAEDVEALKESVSEQEKILAQQKSAEKRRASLASKQIAESGNQLAAQASTKTLAQDDAFSQLRLLAPSDWRFLARPGPMFDERAYLACILYYLDKYESGFPGNQYLQEFEQLNNYARTNNIAALRRRMHEVCAALRVPQPEQALPNLPDGQRFYVWRAQQLERRKQWKRQHPGQEWTPRMYL